VGIAATVWLWAGVIAAALALRALLRSVLPGSALAHGVVGGTLFMAQPGYQTVVNGQWGLLLLATTTTALLLVRASRPRLGAVAALAWLAKPQLFLGYALGCARRDRSFALWAAAFATAVALAATVTAPGWVSAWTGRVAPVRLGAPATLYAALTEIAGPAGLFIAVLVIAIAAAICLRPAARSDASLALWSSLSLVAAPYMWSYDQLLLLPPMVLTAGVVARRDRRAATIVILGFCIAFAIATPALYGVALARGRETFSAFMPLAVFVACAVILRRDHA
jgi:hypothetical protein